MYTQKEVWVNDSSQLPPYRAVCLCVYIHSLLQTTVATVIDTQIIVLSVTKKSLFIHFYFDKKPIPNNFLSKTQNNLFADNRKVTVISSRYTLIYIYIYS